MKHVDKRPSTFFTLNAIQDIFTIFAGFWKKHQGVFERFTGRANFSIAPCEKEAVFSERAGTKPNPIFKQKLRIVNTPYVTER